VRRDAVLAARQAALDDARKAAAVEAEEREIARQRVEAEHADALAADARSHQRAVQSSSNRADLARADDALASERARRSAEDQAFADQKRRESRLAELAAMAELEAQIAEREHRQKLETMDKLTGQSEAAMIAMQASDLAEKEHGAAFAEALGRIADGDAARRERERAAEAAKESARAIADLAKAAIEANAKVAAARAAAPSVCPTCGQGLAPGARFCGGCGTALV
jgi:hypothetical protein